MSTDLQCGLKRSRRIVRLTIDFFQPDGKPQATPSSFQAGKNPKFLCGTLAQHGVHVWIEYEPDLNARGLELIAFGAYASTHSNLDGLEHFGSCSSGQAVCHIYRVVP